MAHNLTRIIFSHRRPQALLDRYFPERHDALTKVAFDELVNTESAGETIFKQSRHYCCPARHKHKPLVEHYLFLPFVEMALQR